MYGETSNPEEIEYEKWECPKCQYELWTGLNFKNSKLPQDSTR